MSEIILTIEGVDLFELFGENDAKLNLLRSKFSDLKIVSRGNILKIAGEKKEAQEAKAKIEAMVRSLRQQHQISLHDVQEILDGSNPFEHRISENSNPDTTILHRSDGSPIKAKTRNQKLLVEAAENNDVVFAIGPAGTGKTYTAVALAVRALKNRLVKKIILTRPAVEAGENLGFLPGDLKDKIDPYLRPLYDALDDMIPPDKLNQFITTRIIEVAPLAFMRGRTLDNAFIILDEAQNATLPQLKMFLTRLGPSAKAIITGDLTQIDLPHYQKSGLGISINRLEDIEGIAVVRLSASDVVRHRLVKAIIDVYSKLEAEQREKNEKNELKKEKENTKNEK